MEDVACRQTEALLQVGRRKRQHGDDTAAEVRCMAAHGVDDQLGCDLSCIGPLPASWQNRLATCRPGGASESSTVLGMSISMTGSRDMPVRRASACARSMYSRVGAIRMPERWISLPAGPLASKRGSSDSATFMRKLAEPLR